MKHIDIDFSDIVSGTADAVQEKVKARDFDFSDVFSGVSEAVNQAVKSQDFHNLEKTVRENVEAVRRAVTPKEPPKQLYGSTGGKLAGGILKIVFGAILSITCTTLMGVFSFVQGLSTAMIPGCALGGALLGVGVVDVTFVNRYKSYRRILGNKTTASLQALAGAVGKSVRFVKKDLLKMFGKGLFLEGHLDHEQTMLITSHATFQEFENHRLLLEQRKKEAAQPKAADPAAEVWEKGKDFLRQLRQCNDRIPGEAVSEKISRMELLTQRIFDRARSNPEVIPDLKKLMTYYLPMTVKLLNAYADMEGLEGENVAASRREIEGTLDTLNTAFEKLLDQLFQDTAWDLSSDISVLNTMLAQEGLTEDELTKLRKNNH